MEQISNKCNVFNVNYVTNVNMFKFKTWTCLSCVLAMYANKIATCVLFWSPGVDVFYSSTLSDEIFFLLALNYGKNYFTIIVFVVYKLS